jgi:hypothetical protein
MPKLVENPNRTSPFDGAHHIRYRELGRHHDDEVNMVNLDVQFNHFTFEMFTKGPNAPADLLTDLPAEDAKAVFGCPHNVILAMPQGV